MTKIENAIIDGFRIYVNIAQGRIDRMSELNEDNVLHCLRFLNI